LHHTLISRPIAETIDGKKVLMDEFRILAQKLHGIRELLGNIESHTHFSMCNLR
jgi:hypothetical protein